MTFPHFFPLSTTLSRFFFLLFVRHPGRVLTHRHILREIWGPKSEEHRQYLRVYVTHLRQNIESDPASPSLIKTEPGIGYRFISNEAF
jgi:two-component system KDP operon response regulator KdpE